MKTCLKVNVVRESSADEEPVLRNARPKLAIGGLPLSLTTEPDANGNNAVRENSSAT